MPDQATQQMTSDELKLLRKALGLSQDELGDAIGMSRISVGLMERGQAPIEKRTELAVRYLAVATPAPAFDSPKAIEAAARALCRRAGHPENIRFEGQPMWASFVDEATAAIAAAKRAAGVTDTNRQTPA